MTTARRPGRDWYWVRDGPAGIATIGKAYILGGQNVEYTIDQHGNTLGLLDPA